jgi:hypothetical protein
VRWRVERVGLPRERCRLRSRPDISMPGHHHLHAPGTALTHGASSCDSYGRSSHRCGTPSGWKRLWLPQLVLGVSYGRWPRLCESVFRPHQRSLRSPPALTSQQNQPGPGKNSLVRLSSISKPLRKSTSLEFFINGI